MDKYLWGYVVLGVIAIPATFGWSWGLHKIVQRYYPRSPLAGEAQEPADRVWWIPLIMGVLERLVITTLVGWSVSASAAFIAGWIAVKAAGGWGVWNRGGRYGRVVFSVGLLGSALSILFALAGGLVIAAK